ncbi:peptidoglycan DD-metalloendopeptidase family protein [Halomonas sp. GD1P12]|uniref:peptidoglycan DD-metalloendopeptidase family protein n=1 Tax=Halomonas sp. GD1P12 TaxID=2982691 RepID=UPI0021E41A08|nr:peptidoglycan DD-metalloendopeptidase family protein [Halomonas sp. GD1P12]UYF99089.1 peptidoglycan DD-metalloendopeptidase family protein [Halomonas sp. GD1P12]
MRKVFTLSLVALAISGCVNQPSNAPQVRDLSEARRAVESSPQYTVAPGDTLYGIAWQYNLDYRELAAMNNIAPPYQIQPGQTITLRQGGGANAQGPSPADQSPPARQGGAVATGLGGGVAIASNETGGQNTVQSSDQQMDWLLPDESAIERNQRITAERGDTNNGSNDGQAPAREEAPIAEPEAESSIEEAPAATPEPEAPAEPEPQPEPVESTPEPAAAPEAPAAPDRSSRTFTPAETINWRWPADGQVAGGFGEGETITAGIDITGQKGQPVRAAGPGIVVYAGSGVRGYGNLILLKHNDQFLSAYAHNDSLRVSENDVVEAGEVIATMGDSDTDSVKLHFEVRRDGQPENPLDFLPSR